MIIYVCEAYDEKAHFPVGFPVSLYWMIQHEAVYIPDTARKVTHWSLSSQSSACLSYSLLIPLYPKLLSSLSLLVLYLLFFSAQSHTQLLLPQSLHPSSAICLCVQVSLPHFSYPVSPAFSSFQSTPMYISLAPPSVFHAQTAQAASIFQFQFHTKTVFFFSNCFVWKGPAPVL